MLKRLEQVEPIYKVADWIDDWRRKEELTEMITAFPEGATIISDHDTSLVSELKGVMSYIGIGYTHTEWRED